MLLLCVLNIENIGLKTLKTTRAVIVLCVCLCVGLLSSFHRTKHPFYLGVTDLKYEAASQTLNVSVKLFTNDLEDALRKTSQKNIDILNPKNKTETDSVLSSYIKKRLLLKINSAAVNLHFIGYEREEEAIWTYFEIKKVSTPKNIHVHTTLLYDYIDGQTNIVHADVNGIKKSSKVTNPDSDIELTF